MNYRKIILKNEFDNNLSVLEKILVSKNLTDKNEIEKFLNPSKDDFISPFAFSDMEKAKERIEFAIKNEEKILIWGDFDCDGVTSTTILYKALKELGANVIEFIPDRLLQGHGLNSKELVTLVAKEKVKLVITVDCGISNVSEVNLLKGLKVDTIITDHHTTDIELPNAFAIINPQVTGAIKEEIGVEDIKSLTYNSGSIVAYKLALALLEKSNNKELKEELLVIASCGAIADVVPLLGENRAIVTEGLKILNDKKFNSHKGIYSLLFKNLNDKPITSIDIGFVLAPRINAVGRLANAKLSFEFLNENDNVKLDTIIQKLDNYNTIRQSKCQETFEEAKKYLEENKKEQTNPAIILLNPDWHVGIIGIVAARIVEEYNKPCFLMTIDENNNARCSIRSNDKINVYNVLKENQELFLGFGGHKLAGGCSFSLNEKSFDEVKNSLLKTIKETITNDREENILKADICLDPKEINLELLSEISKFEPFGQNNEAPLCLMKDIFLDDFKTIGKENNHLRFCFSKNNKKFQGVKWQDNNLEIPLDSICDIAFYPRLNKFNDIESVQFEIVDIYSDCIKSKETKNSFKIFDHRKKTGILSDINEYLSNKELDIALWAKTAKTKEILSKYENLNNAILNENNHHKGLMFFDYPSTSEELIDILNAIKPNKIHFMNTNIDENLENYIKQFQGMIKYCSNKLNGELDLDRISQALGASNNFIQISLEIMENLEAITILDIDKIQYLKPFSFEEFRLNSMFDILKEEFEQILTYKKFLLDAKIDELEKICFESMN